MSHPQDLQHNKYTLQLLKLHSLFFGGYCADVEMAVRILCIKISPTPSNSTCCELIITATLE